MGPEQLFDAGMNRISGSLRAATTSLRSTISAAPQKGYGPPGCLGIFLRYRSDRRRRPTRPQIGIARPPNKGPLAQWLLGRLYFMGSGLPRTTPQRRSGSPVGEPEQPLAAYLLGGVMWKRLRQSPQWFRIAANKVFRKGNTGMRAPSKKPRSARTALRLRVFLVALEAGYGTAQNDLGELDGILSRDQIDQAKTKARKLEDSVTDP